ncbi:MAG: glutathione S-transferase [Myxococcales bacterium FL481]|nr:MAG: glutathione S-transferase [Myxococcales bacterium FL481]
MLLTAPTVSTPLPVLYSFRRCPYAIRARMAMAVAGQPAELREVLLRDKPQAMLEAGQRGTVPLLVLPDRTVLEQSVEIMDWTLRRRDPQGWLAQRDDPRLMGLLDANDGPFKRALDQYKYPDRFPGSSEVATAKDRALAHLQRLDEQLCRDAYLGGEAPGYFDAALFPFVRQFAAVDRAWFSSLSLGPLVAWWAAMLAHPAFTTVMAKVPVWQPGAPATEFLATLQHATAPDHDPIK